MSLKAELLKVQKYLIEYNLLSVYSIDLESPVCLHLSSVFMHAD